MSTRLPLSSYGVYDADAGATEWCRANFYLEFVQHRGESLVELATTSTVVGGDARQTPDPF